MIDKCDIQNVLWRPNEIGNGSSGFFKNIPNKF